MNKLPRVFFERPTLDVAQALLGKRLVFNNLRGLITETEAYIGQDDPACHAFRGKTKRTAVMFGPAGYSYVYLIYGMYHCLNIVTEQKGFPAAVLIRGLLLEEAPLHLNGPGKLCKHLSITREHNALDLIESSNFYVEETGLAPIYRRTPRIGIRGGTDKPWRFIVENPTNFSSYRQDR